jgi:hypothetical protein
MLDQFHAQFFVLSVFGSVVFAEGVFSRPIAEVFSIGPVTLTVLPKKIDSSLRSE